MLIPSCYWPVVAIESLLEFSCLWVMNKMVRVKVVKVLTKISGSHDVMGRSLGSASVTEFCHLLCIWTLSLTCNVK